MYYSVVLLLMLALPVLSIAIEGAMGGATSITTSMVKWFAFWSVGVRLFLAGLRQTLQPKYTAEVLLGLDGTDVLFVIRELGFANLAIGTLGLSSLVVDEWRLATALVGGVFYGLAGINHLFQPHRTRLENVAMLSDLFAAAVLLGLVAVVAVGHRMA